MKFQSTLPARGATRRRACHAGELCHFNPRSPHGERQRAVSTGVASDVHFNPRSPHGERHRPVRHRSFRLRISIHAPRTGSDAAAAACLSWTLYFNPRSPHGERRFWRNGGRGRGRFQSTLPARGATRDGDGGDLMEVISIHAPRTGSDRAFLRKSAEIGISIHAPRTGSDVCWITFSTRNCQFQSTLPARGATAAGGFLHYMHNHFNPRSLHGERRHQVQGGHDPWHFNPRSLHGERPTSLTFWNSAWRFQSTLPARGATHVFRVIGNAERFQSTLPARGATRLD